MIPVASFERMEGIVRRGVRVAGLAAMAFILAACTRTATITEVVLLEGDTQTLTVSVNTCNAHPRVAVVEGEQVITLAVQADPQPVGADDCADSISVELGAPLGDRRVIDGATGEELAVVGRS